MRIAGTDYGDGVRNRFLLAVGKSDPQSHPPLHEAHLNPPRRARLAPESHTTLPCWGLWEIPSPFLPRGLRAREVVPMLRGRGQPGAWPAPEGGPERGRVLREPRPIRKPA